MSDIFLIGPLKIAWSLCKCMSLEAERVNSVGPPESPL